MKMVLIAIVVLISFGCTKTNTSTLQDLTSLSDDVTHSNPNDDIKSKTLDTGKCQDVYKAKVSFYKSCKGTFVAHNYRNGSPIASEEKIGKYCKCLSEKLKTDDIVNNDCEAGIFVANELMTDEMKYACNW